MENETSCQQNQRGCGTDRANSFVPAISQAPGSGDWMKRPAPRVNSGLASGGLETSKKRRKEEYLENELHLGGGGCALGPLDVYVVGFMWFMGDMRGEMGLEKGLKGACFALEGRSFQGVCDLGR